MERSFCGHNPATCVGRSMHGSAGECLYCNESNPSPPAKPWRVLRVTDRGPTATHRYCVEGENHYVRPGKYGFEFHWMLDRLPEPDDRYDFAGCAWQGPNGTPLPAPVGASPA